MNVFVVIELTQECNGEKVIDNTTVFSTREKALKFLHERYLDVRLLVDSDVGELAAVYYDDDGWYAVTANDGDFYEGYLSKELEIDAKSV